MQPRFYPGEKMRIVPGDDWLAQYNLSDVELTKVDVEGFEESALQGLRQTLEACRPAVLVEVSRFPGIAQRMAETDLSVGASGGRQFAQHATFQFGQRPLDDGIQLRPRLAAADLDAE